MSMKKSILTAITIILFCLIYSTSNALVIETRNKTDNTVFYSLYSVDHKLEFKRPIWVFGGEIKGNLSTFTADLEHNQPPHRYCFEVRKWIDNTWKVTDSGMFTITPDWSYWLILIK